MPFKVREDGGLGEAIKLKQVILTQEMNGTYFVVPLLASRSLRA